jgi:acid stress-induced BolA-like protein IbaG/YrbA
MAEAGLRSAEDICATARAMIEEAIPGARAEVTPASPGHFEIAVTGAAFAGKSLVQQQQMVYRAIAPLMAGDAAPMHAVDRLRTKAE